MLRKSEKDMVFKDALKQWLERGTYKKSFDENSIKSLWESVIGTYIAKNTQDIFIKNRKLFIKLDSSAIKNQLMMMKSEILTRINENMNEVVLSEIVFV